MFKRLRQHLSADPAGQLLRHIDKNGYGVEIGPSHRPVAPKRAGYKVHIIDHLDREALIEKYKEQNVAVENIEEVDFVWKGEPYAELTGRSKFYDWVIASHLIEHTPDLIGFINECESILNENGVLSLAVPNLAYCFDHFRPTTGIARVIDSHLSRNKIHTPGTAVEYTLYRAYRDGQVAWREKYGAKGEFTLAHSLDDARNAMDRAMSRGDYQDFHAWCFTPHSFRLLIHDLFCLGFISLKEVSFFPTEGYEFYMTLGPKGKGPNLSRLEMLKAAKLEASIYPKLSDFLWRHIKRLTTRRPRYRRHSDSK